MNYASLEITYASLIALGIVMIVVKKPVLFWYILIIVNIVGNGPRLMRYFFWDELLSGAAVLGALLRISIHRSEQQRDIGKSHHKAIFSLWAWYMVMQSIVGLIANNDIRITRWILFYIILLLLSYILYNRSREFPFPTIRQFSLTVLVTSAIYFIAYLSVGIFYDVVLAGSFGRFSLEYGLKEFGDAPIWSGTATAVLPILLTLPAIMLTINDRNKIVRIFAWSVLFFLMIIGFYYDSRIVWIAIMSIGLVSVRRIKFTKIISIAVIFSILFFAFSGKEARIFEFMSNLFKASHALWVPEESDLSRNQQFKAGFMRLTDNFKVFTIGDGLYSHRFTIIPHIEELFKENPPPYDILIQGVRDDTTGGLTIYRTTAFTALLIDTGVIGILLFFMNYIFVVLKVIKQKSMNRNIFLAVIFISFIWLFINNINDVILLYLLIMPKGLIEQLNKNSKLITPLRDSARIRYEIPLYRPVLRA